MSLCNTECSTLRASARSPEEHRAIVWFKLNRQTSGGLGHVVRDPGGLAPRWPLPVLPLLGWRPMGRSFWGPARASTQADIGYSWPAVASIVWYKKIGAGQQSGRGDSSV